MIWIFLAVLVPSIASLLGTNYIREYALRTSMMDVPNDRSSHTVPTPRGGGIAMAATILTAIGLLTFLLPEQRSTAIGILGGGLLIAGVGLLDDRFDLSAKSRLVVHFLAAVWFLSWLGGVGSVSVLGFELGILASLVAVVFIVWCTNLYNFMDGLDGFAGGQALVAATTAALICYRAGDSLLAFSMFVTAGAAAGFLIWNWPPARIFMGDCGSGFLGFLFGALAIAAYRNNTMPLAAGLMLIIIFFSDSTLTLLRRMWAGERWYKPHRTHAYQLATQLGASHRQVTLASLAGFTVVGSLAFVISLRQELAPLLLGLCAIVIVGAWMLINRLFVGRTNALASIKGEQTRVKQDETATIVYLRFRRMQSRMKTWRSAMPKTDLLTEATDVASELGYTVSHDWLDGLGGGRCEVAGEKWILLDFNMSRQDQVRQILLAIQDELDTVDSMSTDLRSVLHRASTPVMRKAA